MKKRKIVIALLLFTIGWIRIIDSILFDIRTSQYVRLDEYHKRYVERYPSFIQPLFEKPYILFFFLCFIVAGFIFISEKQKIFLILGIISFVLAIWHLFPFM